MQLYRLWLHWARRVPGLVLLLTLVVSGLLILLSWPKLKIDADVSSVLPDGHPQALAFRSYIQHFGAVEPGFILVRDDDFSLEIEPLLEALEEMPGIASIQAGPELEPFLPLFHAIAEAPQLFLSEEGWQAWSSQLSGDELRLRLNKIPQQLAGFNPPEELDLLRLDPTGVLRHISLPVELGSGLLRVEDGRYRTPDGLSQVLLFQPAQPPFDSEFSLRLVENLQHILAAQLGERPHSFFCGHLYAASDAAGIRSGISRTLCISLLLMLLVFWASFGRFAAFFLPLPAVLLGLASCAATLALSGTSLNILTAAFGSVVIGLGVDASIHIMAVVDWRQPEEAMDRMCSLVRPLLSACATTCVAFASLLLLHLSVLRSLGLLCAVGIAVSQLASILLVPVFQARFGVYPRIQIWGVRWLRRPLAALARGPRSLKWGSLFLVLACLSALPHVKFQANLQEMRKKDQRLERMEASFRQEFSHLPRLAYWVCDAPDYNSLRRFLAEDAEVLGSMGVPLTLDPRQWLPQDSARDRVKAPAAWPVPEQLNPQAFLWPDLSLRSGDVVHTEAWRAAVSFCLQELDGSWLWGLKIMPGPELGPLPVLPNGRLVEMEHLNQAIADVLRADFKRLLLVLVPAVVLMLLLTLRRMRATLVSLYSLAAAVLATLALLVAIGGSINLANLVVVPLLLGIGIDDAIHMAVWAGHRQCLHHWTASAGAIVLTTLTTILGFGSLATSDYPALTHMGILVNLGLLLSLLATLVLLPLFLGRLDHDPSSAAAEPAKATRGE
jgi:hypothetical protein